MDTAVIIIGAGPTGLMLAGELRLAGVQVTVVEQRLVRTAESRGVGVTARAVELLRQRGLLQRLGAVEISNEGHFGGIPLDFGVLEGSHFGARGVPQFRIEHLLEEWVQELGGIVLRGHTLVGLYPGGDAVTAVLDGPEGRSEHTAAYLVGCDGARSSVRRLIGFDFPGTSATRTMYLADVVGAGVRPRLIGRRVAGGMIMSGPIGPGTDRIIVCPHGIPASDDSRQPSFAEVAGFWEQLGGESLHGARATWISSFTDATRQVTEYRRGRVLLAGDAAHIHLPAGGQGMSLGLQDAVNLGWKLAATVNGWAPDGLLGTYHDERHPVGARVLRNTLAQGTLYLSGAEIEPLRTVMTELMALPDVGRHLSGMVSGLDVTYDVGCFGHPLLGRRMPDGPIELADGRRTRIADLLRGIRGVLIDGGQENATAQHADAWSDRVDTIRVRGLPAGRHGSTGSPGSVLVRPDGYVVWASPGAGDVGRALERWFGRSRTP